MSNTVSPTASSERFEILDVLRGFAVAGILIGNMQWFSGYGKMPAVLMHASPLVDQAAQFLINFFVEGKFYSIFSFLFGFGFALQIDRAAQFGDARAAVFKRRLGWLLLIGLLHTYLLWAGDILTVYAVTGFALFLFRKKSDGRLLNWAIGLIALPVVAYAGFYFLTWLFSASLLPAPTDPARKIENWQRTTAAVSQGGYFDIMSGYNLRYALGRYEGLVTDMRFPKILGMFLFGFYAYRRGYLQKLADHRDFFRRVLFYGAIFGVVGNLVLAALMWKGGAFNPPSWAGVAGMIAFAVGVPAFAAAYLAALCLLWLKARRSRWLLTLFAPVGRMALTNYLMQSAICVLIFYGFGLGLFGQYGALAATAVALGVFVFQVLASNLWLKYFLYGPAEWIWRQLTYGRRLKLRPPKEEKSAPPENVSVSYNS